MEKLSRVKFMSIRVTRTGQLDPRRFGNFQSHVIAGFLVVNSKASPKKNKKMLERIKMTKCSEVDNVDMSSYGLLQNQEHPESHNELRSNDRISTAFLPDYFLELKLRFVALTACIMQMSRSSIYDKYRQK